MECIWGCVQDGVNRGEAHGSAVLTFLHACGAPCVLLFACLQLTCRFSQHRELLIRNNNDRNWDYLRQQEGPTAAAAAAADRSPGAAGAGAGAWQQQQQQQHAQEHHMGSAADCQPSPSKAAAAAAEAGSRQLHEPVVVTGGAGCQQVESVRLVNAGVRWCAQVVCCGCITGRCRDQL
jgi:hypothetical protein